MKREPALVYWLGDNLYLNITNRGVFCGFGEPLERLDRVLEVIELESIHFIS